MNEPKRIVLDGELSIYRAAELREMLLAALSGVPADMEVDLAGVTEIDSSGVQLLLAARQAAQEAGHSLALVNHSEAVADVVALLGLNALLGDCEEVLS